MHTIREITRLATMLAGLIAPRIHFGLVSALPQLRLDYALATPRMLLIYALTAPWLRSPASIVDRRAITLIVRLGT